MIEISIAISAVTLILVIITFLLIKKSVSGGIEPLLKSEMEKMDRSFRDESARNREETSRNAKSQREELNSSVIKLGEQLTSTIGEISKRQKDQLDIFTVQLNQLTQTNEQKFDKLQSKVESN